MPKLRIIHVSDLHLFVDRDGNHRSLDARAWSAKLMNRLGDFLEKSPNDALRIKASEIFSGLNTHSGAALQAMMRTLDDMLADANYSSIVVQTGDVSTFGALGRGEDVRFPEWEYWQGEVVKARRRLAADWIDIFGNHDVWPGTLPLLGAACIEEVVKTFRARHFPKRMPSVHRCTAGGISIELHALNSVLCGVLDNTRAIGELLPDVLDPSGVELPDPLAEVESNATAGDTIRLLLMHHPPHHFEKPGGGSEGGLRDAQRLGTWLESREAAARFHLILAGHRHAIDPPRPSHPDYVQPPLPAHSLQLVCGTPTQASCSDASFSVYELQREEEGVTLVRKIYSRKGLADRRFTPSEGGTFQLS